MYRIDYEFNSAFPYWVFKDNENIGSFSTMWGAKYAINRDKRIRRKVDEYNGKITK